jgi:hypothetical protein
MNDDEWNGIANWCRDLDERCGKVNVSRGSSCGLSTSRCVSEVVYELSVNNDPF